jgi:hypothetical protein
MSYPSRINMSDSSKIGRAVGLEMSELGGQLSRERLGIYKRGGLWMRGAAAFYLQAAQCIFPKGWGIGTERSPHG